VFPDADYGDFANRGVTLGKERLYLGTVDGRLVCLLRVDGRRCPGFGIDGAVDLTAGLRRPPQYRGEYGVTSPPALWRNLVIVGSSIADNSRAQMASGEVRAFDAISGALRWTFHPLPADAPAGGANAWTRIVVDDRTDTAYVSTGSPSPDYAGGTRPGDAGDANSLVALDARTGNVRWRFKTVHHDLWDYDVATPALLYADARGPAVAVGSKNGNLFLLDRRSGRPRFDIDERPVPASDVEGEAAWATQPFPKRPAPLVPQSVTEADLWGATPADLEACRTMFRGLRNDGVFTPPSLRGSLTIPGPLGGMNWSGLAFDPASRLLIAPVNHMPWVVRLLPADGREPDVNLPSLRLTETEQRGARYRLARDMFLAPSGAPCVRPPWGELVAVHADTGEPAWRVPLGTMLGQPGSLNLGGIASSGEGVLFIGGALDARLRAIEAATGKELWSAELPTSARATPLVYATREASYVAIAAGGHEGRTALGTTVQVFRLAP
jgi:quinoprotein glucose dehydrogenase